MAKVKNQEVRSKNKAKVLRFKNTPSKETAKQNATLAKTPQRGNPPRPTGHPSQEGMSFPLPGERIKERGKTRKVDGSNINNQPKNSSVFFPRIFRVITESWFLAGVLCVVLLCGIAMVGVDMQKNLQKKYALEQKRETMQKEIAYWQGIARKYPGYRDAYFQLALLEYQLGDFQISQNYLNRVELLDPNFQDAYMLEKLKHVF